MTGLSLKTFLAILAASLLCSPVCLCFATLPHLADILPTGGQRGSELEVTFQGDRLQDTEEILCYEPGVQVTKLTLITNTTVKAELRIGSDAMLGEHHLRVRTTSGISELRTFSVGLFPVVEETEPNDQPDKAQTVSLNTTVAGVIKNEDIDCFAVEVKKGQRLSAEVEGMRLGRGNFDPRLSALDPGGKLVADSDDTWLGKQDPYVTFIAQQDGKFTFRLREATYGGSEQCRYRLHIGFFPRPAAVFPAGGQVGATNLFVFVNPGAPSFTNLVMLPGQSQDKFGLFGELDDQKAPTPNWIRVSPFPNVPSSGTNHTREQAAVCELQAPFALGGIISSQAGEDWFRFPTSKGRALNLAVYARRLHSPLDSVIEVYDPLGKSLGSNDDALGADSVLRFTPPETTNYFVRIRDTLGQGGPDFVYRLEVTPDEPGLIVKIPEVARNDTQSRQFIAVPRGNRVATLINARRSNFAGEVLFSITNLPAGLTMSTNRMAANVDSMPLMFEAAADAAIGGRLLDLTGTGTNGTNFVSGNFRQEIELVQGPNNSTFYGTSVSKLCVAVTKEAPFKLRISEPKVPLVQSGSMPLEITAERKAGFEEPIELQMVWNPPGVSSQPEITMPKGATNAIYTLNAAPGAETRSWEIAVLGHANVDGGQVFVSSQLAHLEVATPYISGKIETLWANPGKPGKLTLNVQQLKPFEGKAIIKLVGLPDKVTAQDKEITKAEKEVIFDVNVETNCPVGSHKNLFCTVELKEKDTVIPHSIAQGGILRIVPVRKADTDLAAAGGKK